jgi:hypothetical protein
VRSLRFLPLVFVIGIDGFAMFAPYLIAVLAIGYTVRALRPRSEPALAEVAEPTESTDDSLALTL